MKLKAPMNGRLITALFFPDSIGEEWTIKGGECMIWAYLAFLVFEDVELVSNQLHAYVKQGDLFFDAEVPDGVSSPQDIPFNSGKPHLTGKIQTVREFQDQSDEGIGWWGLEELARKFLLSVERGNDMSNRRAMILVDGVHKWIDSTFLDLIGGEDTSVEYVIAAKTGEDGCVEVIGENVYFHGLPDDETGSTDVQAFIKPLSEKEKALVEAAIVCQPDEVQERRRFSGRS